MKARRLATLLALALSILTLVALAGSVAAADSVTIQLKAQNNSGQVGSATLTDLGNGQTKVTVDTTNPTAAAQPIHIHEGTCANLNPAVKYALTTTTNGKSESTVGAALATILASPYSVNIHKSAQEAAVYVSCGEIVAQPTGTPRTGGGGMAGGNAPFVAATLAALLTIAVAGTSYALRRRAA